MVLRNQEASQVQRKRHACKYSNPSCPIAFLDPRSQLLGSAVFTSDRFTNHQCNREDGSIDHSSTAPRAANATAAHKLGPKANQGAINAGLRALDRSGKPCRKWHKGSFKLKSFTGVVWEIPRWKAPPKVTVEGNSDGSASGESSKENKDNSQIESEKSNNGVDVEMGSTASHNVSSPAPSISAAPTAPIADPAPVVAASA
jgi:hypothetical protein